MEEILNNVYQMTAFSDIIASNGTYLIMYLLAFVLLYLGIVKHFEPLLLIPIAFGVLIANFPGGDMEQELRSLTRLAKLEGDYEVYPGHMEFSTLEFERRYNPYLTAMQRRGMF